MDANDIDDLSVKALRIFLLIYRTGSVSRTAELLGQDQSSVSYTLGKLRTSFSDPLFVRTGRGLQPTETCERLVSSLGSAIETIDHAVADREFVPDESRRRFTVSSNYLERAIFLAPLLRSLRREAPGISLDIVPSGGGAAGYRQLVAGECDMLLSPIPVPDSKIFQHLLARDRYACFADAEARGGRGEITRAEWLASDHLIVTYGNQFEPAFLRAVGPEAAAIGRINCASTSDLPSMLKGTDLIATAPSLLAPVMGARFIQFRFPFAETGLDFYLSWTQRTNAEPAHRWLRERLISVAADILR
ncbi:MAG: LysR family transcriptional regulator [Defluviicoccus sp.]|nr:LysR family transcriptional regulator [Defluviicoccus sp.]MDE0274385.1 LysR family transcriptional regulator [Defluviicoccus sp.]